MAIGSMSVAMARATGHSASAAKQAVPYLFQRQQYLVNCNCSSLAVRALEGSRAVSRAGASEDLALHRPRTGWYWRGRTAISRRVDEETAGADRFETDLAHRYPNRPRRAPRSLVRRSPAEPARSFPRRSARGRNKHAGASRRALEGSGSSTTSTGGSVLAGTHYRHRAGASACARVREASVAELTGSGLPLQPFSRALAPFAA